MKDRKNKILVCVDQSYWGYYTLFGSVYEFQRTCPAEAAAWIKDPEEVDQHNLPDLTNCATFVKILRKFVMKRLETIDWHLKQHFQEQIDISDGIDFVFALDDRVTKSFRKDLYPEYKATRHIAKRSYNTYKIQEYILNVLFPELQVEQSYGYHLVKVPGAEGDDVIATIFRNLGKEYMLNVLIASDRDYLQLDNVHQINLQGKEVLPIFGDVTLTPQDYLLGKIIVGDKSDNIEQVFEKTGEKRALKLIRDKAELKKRLLEDVNAAKQFELNKKLISFDEIPKELEAQILEEVNKSLYENEVLNAPSMDLRDFMTL